MPSQRKRRTDYLSHLKEGKEDNHRIFSAKRADGTFKSIEETRKEVTKIISASGKHLTRNEKVTVKGANGKKNQVEVTRKFSPHSFRKGFAVDRAGYYFQKFSSKSALDRYISSRLNNNQKLKDKLDIVRDRINKDRKTYRDLSRMEYAIFFTSVDLGHFRNDVMTAFYTDFKEVQRYIE
ncbi:hypothetical protein [Bacillus sp. EB600]|uniref:hypothetical protein n=1 Tax=Bacillus sp. EB600 TaxID=2806345 RepID=UPI00210D790E|nr:hypothetical protein [Bacillus sp. EB600]MCQ6281601.1 hypothetical protein [Bacillus sp. EB600]